MARAAGARALVLAVFGSFRPTYAIKACISSIWQPPHGCCKPGSGEVPACCCTHALTGTVARFCACLRAQHGPKLARLTAPLVRQGLELLVGALHMFLSMHRVGLGLPWLFAGSTWPQRARQGLELLVGALHKFLSMHYLRIDVAEFGGGGGGGELPPVVDNELVTITPVLLEARGAEQARPRAAWTGRPC
jgi:hypothetical protein